MRNIKTILLLVGIALMAGCASSPQLLDMIPKDEKLVFESTGKSLKIVRATGGEETNPMGSSKINAKDYKLALIESIKKSNLFTQVSFDNISDYELTATILSQDQPAIGLDMTVTLTVAYVIKSSSTGDKVFDKPITASYTASVGEAFVGVTRLRKANEGAVRENIKRFLWEISKLQF